MRPGRTSVASTASDSILAAEMLLIRRALDLYKTYIIDTQDTRVTQWPFMGSLAWPLGIIAVYVWFVKYKGPELMANRTAFDLKWVMVAFNAFQVLINAYLFYLCLTLGWFDGYSLRCQPVDYSVSPKAMEAAFGVYLYYLVKLSDLLDTVFYVMRKRDRQISFLHVYHHGGMVLLAYIGTSYFAGGNSVFLGTLNTFVHAVMYSYYLSTALRPGYHDRLWWKKYLTQLQMIQFLFIIIHAMQLMWEDCGFPNWTSWLLVPQNCFMLVLFADFYRQNYLRKQPPSGTAKASPTTPPAVSVNGWALDHDKAKRKDAANGGGVASSQSKKEE